MSIGPNPFRKFPALLAVCLALAVALAACGYKSWPKPQAKEDRFEWQSVNYQRKDSCLDIAAQIKGAAKNLDRVIVQLQSEDSGCMGCPFQPDIFLEYGPGSTDFQRSERGIHVTTCALTPGKIYRYRLVGVNLYTALGLTLSPVQVCPPSTP